MTWISTWISGVLHCSGTPSESWWDVMRTAYWRRYWKWAFSVSASDTIILSYTFIYVHIRAYTCTYMLFTLSRFLPTSPTHTCIYMPHMILAYTCIYWHILAYTGRRGWGLREGHALTPTTSGIRVRVRHCTILSICQTLRLRVRLPVAACGCGLADSESADLKRHGPACA